MNEKFSEQHIRKEKVDKFKQKILKEIEMHKNRTKKKIEMCLSQDNDCYWSFDECINIYFSLLQLEEYIKNNTFMEVIEKSEEYNIVIYTISMKNIDIWLQEDYHFVNYFLIKAQENNFNVFPLLKDDKYFQFEFTSIFDVIEYNRKMNEI